MGACVAKPEGCVGMKPVVCVGIGKPGVSGKPKRRRRKRAIKKIRQAMATIYEVPRYARAGTNDARPSFPGNNASQGSAEEYWYDPDSLVEADYDDSDDEGDEDDDDDFQSALDGGSVASYPSFNEANHEEVRANNPTTPSDMNIKCPKCGEYLTASVERNAHQPQYGSHKSFVSHDDVPGVDGTAGCDGGVILLHCGSLSSNCLPCLPPIDSIVDRRRSLCCSPGRKVNSSLSFKRRSGEVQDLPTLLSSKTLLEKPLAGSQVPFCPAEKSMLNCWSQVEPGTFKVRGANYLKDKKKEFAPNFAAYYPFGVDVYLCQRKVDHIARFVKLPTVSSSGKLPSILVVNVQIPLYPAAIFQNEADGEGMSIVLYFKLSDSHSKELASNCMDDIRRLIDNEVDKVKGFTMDTMVPVRERLKILGRVANVDDLPMNAAERKIMHKYNEKPVLSRPQHEFYSEEEYFEIDLDMHRFSYISRKGFETFIDRLKLCVLDVGLTIQGNTPEELPEHLLCCVRLNMIDFTEYQQLNAHSMVQGAESC